MLRYLKELSKRCNIFKCTCDNTTYLFASDNNTVHVIELNSYTAIPLEEWYSACLPAKEDIKPGKFMPKDVLSAKMYTKMVAPGDCFRENNVTYLVIKTTVNKNLYRARLTTGEIDYLSKPRRSREVCKVNLQVSSC